MSDDLATRLRSSGYRLTPQRELVLQAVERLGHATPEEVLADVRDHSEAVNASTIYRNLEVLEELGLVRHTHLGGRAPTYHSTAEPVHAHLVCRVCGGETSLPEAVVTTLASELQAAEGFAIDVGHLAVFGTCRRCTP